MEALFVDDKTSQLYFKKIDDPIPQENELIVKIKSTALNRADIMQRYGQYPLPDGVTPIPGLEMAGVVEEIGSNVKGFEIGDRVCALLTGGGYAEKVAIDNELAIKIPSYLSFEQAAAIPEAYLTAYLNLLSLAKLKKTDNILIHAGASGVGLAAIQIVKALGASSIVTASSEKKLTVCRENGANETINYKEVDFEKKVKELTNGKGVDVILDFVGASYWQQNIESLSIDGTLVLIGLLGGSIVEHVNLKKVLFKRLQIKATTLRSKTDKEKSTLTKQFTEFALPKIKKRQLMPVIDTVFDWKDVMIAHARMEANENIGKIILNVT